MYIKSLPNLHYLFLLLCLFASVHATGYRSQDYYSFAPQSQDFFSSPRDYTKPSVFYLEPLVDFNGQPRAKSILNVQRRQARVQTNAQQYAIPVRQGARNISDCGDRPPTFPTNCRPSRYRTIDGTCNNLNYPTWGRANTRYDRLIKPIYADGVSAPTVAQSGNALPAARLVSFTLFPDKNLIDQSFSLVTMQYGQIVTHDMGLISGTTQTTPHSTCCTDDGKLIQEDANDPTCYPMEIPPNDPVYARAGYECLNLVRSDTDRRENCLRNFGYAEQLNAVTSFLDLSIIYGSSNDVARQTRANVAGRLRVDVRNNQEWLPANTNKTAICDGMAQNDKCYFAGDTRVNQNPQLTVLHLLFWREHNRIAGILAKLNPHWSDETIFQETRRIVIAIHQHITYYEYVPIIIGVENAYKYGIIYNTKNYVNDYDPSVNPSTINEHSTAAFRYFHTNIQGYLQLVGEKRCSSSCPFLRLSNHFNKPTVLEQKNNFDDLTRGMATQHQHNTDRFFTTEVTNFMFKHNKNLGTDLRATDIQRNRDHGLASYNDFREYCGLKRARNWADFSDWISMENIAKLKGLYETVDDVDLTVGGSLENHVDGTLSGPTFMCILIKQFRKTRISDRYWYESPNKDTGFTIEQLNEIRKSSISRLMCDNGNNILSMQPRGFIAVSKSNPIVKCKDLPSIDFRFWIDIRK